MNSIPEITELPWATYDGEEHIAKVVPVKFSLDGLAQDEIQVLGHLARAAEGMTPIYAQQNHPDFPELYEELLVLEQSARGKDREARAQYNTLLAMANAFWDFFGGMAFRTPYSPEYLHRQPGLSTLEIIVNRQTAPSTGCVCRRA